jgi:hypothetical protein
MKNKNFQNIIIGILIIAIIGFTVYPNIAQARNPFKSFFRALRRTVNFIVKLPDKATRWMGPVLGPIASAILTQNLARTAEIGQILRRVQQADKIFQTIDEQNRVLESLRTIYRNQAGELNSQVEKMEAVRNDFKNKLINDPDYGLKNYMKDVVALDKVIESYRQAATDMEQTAAGLNTGDMIKMLGQGAVKNFLSGSEAIVIDEIKGQINRFINPDIIKSFVERGDENALDVLLNGDIGRLLGGNKDGIDLDELRERIKDRIKDLAQKERDNLKNNWQNTIRDLINQEVKSIKESLPENKEKEDKKPEDLGPIPKDENGCLPGYVFQPRSGVGCVQEDCNSYEYAHWSYEGYCVCGSSGSISENPKDPNKECGYPPTYRSCPGCVYACVHFDEECPEVDPE